MNADQMPAGLELDRLVAEKVMGWHRDCDRWMAGDQMRGWAFEWNPSTNIAHAWEAVDRILSNQGRNLNLQVKAGTCFAHFCGTTEGARADTPPLAICRAALWACA